MRATLAILCLVLVAGCELPPAPAPLRVEVCNGRDDDGDGVVDPDDRDGDGSGTCAADPARADCDDLDPTRHPGATEACNGLDDDCDRQVPLAEQDLDGDGSLACADDCDDHDTRLDHHDRDLDGYSSCGGDCDDLDRGVHPGADEGCNGLDDDCDGTPGPLEADHDLDGLSSCEGDCAPTDPWIGPGDLDHDGISACAPVPDCDDLRADTHPGSVERCNGRDDDCDGVIDGPAATDAPTWFLDTDGDLWGSTPMRDCLPPTGAVPLGGDCDDLDPGRHPGAAERCDGQDQDCDAAVDEDIPTSRWFADEDGDGFGDAARHADACAPPTGHVDNPLDCDDRSPSVHPAAPEWCNGLDDDCDAEIDEAGSDPSTWYADADGDGHGTLADVVLSCTAPPGHASLPDDCDDLDPDIHPGATESCDGRDEDCDGLVDDDATDAVAWYADLDADGWGAGPPTAWSCQPQPGLAATTGDCDDHSAHVFPGAAETCDGRDEDCNGQVDDVPGGPTWHPDADGDGHGDQTVTVVACSAPPGSLPNGDDCDDGDPAIFPGALEQCNGRDDDCDGSVDGGATDAHTWYRDRDGDGWGDPVTAIVQCTPPPSYVEDGADCDDRLPTVHPDADERCGGVDEDCDGLQDEADAVDAPTWYPDADGDGYGALGPTLVQCVSPPGAVSTPGDCDDAEPMVAPGQPERCDGLDNDCDGVADDQPIDGQPLYPDSDGDGAGALGSAATSVCADTPTLSPTADDCDDVDPDIRPGHAERCDGRDEDCDGTVDEQATDAPTWFADADGDGFGDPTVTARACSAPPGHLADSSDCDDASDLRFPGGLDACEDGVDGDCDGVDPACPPVCGDGACEGSEPLDGCCDCATTLEVALVAPAGCGSTTYSALATCDACVDTTCALPGETPETQEALILLGLGDCVTLTAWFGGPAACALLGDPESALRLCFDTVDRCGADPACTTLRGCDAGRVEPACTLGGP